MTETVLKSSLDQIFENLPIGSITRAIGNNLYGINFRQTRSAIPRTKDIYGFTFFTRPQLNLDMFNLTNYRAFYSLLTDNDISYQRYVRMLLDPRLKAGGLNCPFVDNLNPFIPILTNNIISLSGWPDIVAPTFTTPAGGYGEEYSITDGVTNHFEAFDIDATFENNKGNPILYLMWVWVKYQTLVFEGILNPYIDMISENEIDYNTRIYRLVLDQQKRYVQFIAASGASFPMNIPTGSLFDFNVDSPLNSRNTEINIRMRCMGFTAFEDILKKEFNETLSIFNPDMRRVLEHDLNNDNSDSYREDPTVVYGIGEYVKIPFALAMAATDDLVSNSFYNVNFRVYPYINLYTNELEWWTDRRRFTASAQASFNSSLENNGTQSNDTSMISD